MLEVLMKKDGYERIKTIEGFMAVTYNLLKQKNLEFLLRLQRLKH